jgi:hypothetical protein
LEKRSKFFEKSNSKTHCLDPTKQVRGRDWSPVENYLEQKVRGKEKKHIDATLLREIKPYLKKELGWDIPDSTLRDKLYSKLI